MPAGGGGSAAVLPPELPTVLAELELDRVTKNLKLNQDPLRNFLRKFMVYVRESVARSLAETRTQVMEDFREDKESMTSALEERFAELEGRIANNPRISKLEEDLPLLRDDLQRSEGRLEGLFDMLTKLEAEVRKDAPTEINDFADVRRIIKDMWRDNESHRHAVREVHEALTSDMDTLQTRCDGLDEVVRVQGRKLEVQGTRLVEAEEIFANLQDEVSTASEGLEKLVVSKAEDAVVQTLQVEVRTLGKLAAKGAEAADIAPRVDSLERSRRSFDTTLQQTKKDVELLQEGERELQKRCDEGAENIRNVDRNARSALQDQCNELIARALSLATRVTAVETELSQASKLLQGWSSKASVSEVASLRSLVGSIVEDIKAKEQAVLFGAKCLSCNRVFDDVQQESNVVNLQGERLRAQAVAEIQRALHSPKADPLEPLSMIAVRVGRPGGVKGKDGSGVFAGRDPANLARGIDDVHLLPARPGSSAATTEPGSATARPPASGRGTPADGTTRSATPNSSRGGRRLPSCSRAPTPASLSVLRDGRPKDGPLDYRSGLTELLGRSGGATAFAGAPAVAAA